MFGKLGIWVVIQSADIDSHWIYFLIISLQLLTYFSSLGMDRLHRNEAMTREVLSTLWPTWKLVWCGTSFLRVEKDLTFSQMKSPWTTLPPGILWITVTFKQSRTILTLRKSEKQISSKKVKMQSFLQLGWSYIHFKYDIFSTVLWTNGWLAIRENK